MDGDVYTSIPDSLQRLARLVSRAFYTMEHVIVIDMLIRNPCMREEDLCDLLKFERKQLRTVLAQLKNDKFIKVKLKMETGPDGKTTRQNYYFINYKIFVNVVKYKLDHMRRKIETEERDNTSRASFNCPSCLKTFTDLEADQLYDFTTSEFRCTFCNTIVEEDQSAVPQKDSRLIIAKFNEQIEPLYNLLHEVEDIKLAPELLEPEPTDLTNIRRESKLRPPGGRDQGQWSGDITRSRTYGIDQDVSISFGDNSLAAAAQVRKERPIWMAESTVAPEMKEEMGPPPSVLSIPEEPPPGSIAHHKQDDIMEVLLAHEKKAGLSTLIIPGAPVDESDLLMQEIEAAASKAIAGIADDVEEMDDEDDEDVSMVTIGDQNIPLHEVTEELIAKMTPSEKDVYIKLMQEAYSNIYE